MSTQLGFLLDTGPTPIDSPMSAQSDREALSPSISSAEAFHARISVLLERVRASMARVLDCGENSRESLASYDRASSSWKTSQRCLVGGLESFSETWPRSGMMLGGTAYQLLPSAPRTDEIASLSSPWPTPSAFDRVAMKALESPEDWLAQHRECLARGVHKQFTLSVAAKANMSEGQIKKLWPTPTAGNFNDGESVESWEARRAKLKETLKNGNGCGTPLAMAAKMWPTPTASESANRNTKPCPSHQIGMHGKVLAGEVGGNLSADWVECLMGFPPGWSEVSLVDQASLKKHGKRRARPGMSPTEAIGSDASVTPSCPKSDT